MSMLQQNEVEAFIIEFITEESNEVFDQLSSSSNFVASQLLDSFSTLNLIVNLEAKYQIKISPLEMADSQLGEITKLAQVVCRKVNQV